MIQALLLAFALEAPKVSLEAPDFELQVIQGTSGRLSDYRGKVVLLHFWATWCPPCREEMPALRRLDEAFRDEGLVVIGVAADRSARTVRRFIKEEAIRFPILLDPGGEVRRAYEVVGLPQSYLIGRDGRFLGRAIGTKDWDSPEAMAFFQRLLKGAFIEGGFDETGKTRLFAPKRGPSPWRCFGRRGDEGLGQRR